jgi:LacI family transcriptional regulator
MVVLGTMNADRMSMEVERRSLADEAVAALREAIRNGELGETMPPERELSTMLGVSRPVLREALSVLENRGDLRREGRRRVVVRKHIPAPDDLRHVRLLCPQAVDVVENELLGIQEYLTRRLASTGVTFDLQTSPSCLSGRPERHLKRLVASHPSTLWLLLHSSAAMQRWFEKTQTPCVVMGGLYPGARLPYIDSDHGAICRHAAGLLRARGHRRVVLLRRRKPLPGDRIGSEAFLAAWNASGDATASAEEALHDESPDRIEGCMDRLMVSKRPPSAFFVFGVRETLAVFSKLAAHRLVAGADVHLLCRDHDPYFEWITPGIAHYQRDRNRFQKALLRLIRIGLAGDDKGAAPVIIPAEFIDGGSLGSV